MYLEIWRCQLILLSYGVSGVSIDTCSCMCRVVHSSTMYRYVTYLVYLMSSYTCIYSQNVFVHAQCVYYISSSNHLLSRVSWLTIVESTYLFAMTLPLLLVPSVLLNYMPFHLCCTACRLLKATFVIKLILLAVVLLTGVHPSYSVLWYTVCSFTDCKCKNAFIFSG